MYYILNPILACLFLSLNILPFFLETYYGLITQFNYSCVLIMFLTVNTRSKNLTDSAYNYFLIVISLVLFLYGNPGSTVSLLASASLPVILFENFKNLNQFNNCFYKPTVVVCLLAIVGAVFILLKTRKHLTNFYYLGEYFGIASINYVSLTLLNISLILYLVLRANQLRHKTFHLRVILFLLTSLCFIASFNYLTRTTLIGSFILLILQVKNSYKVILSCLLTFIIFKNYETFTYDLSAFMGQVITDRTIIDTRRAESALFLINNSLSLDYNLMAIHSYSSLINMLFSIFPFSLLMIYPLIKVYSKIKLNNIDLFALLSVVLGITIYQPDFLSIFTLYFVSTFIYHFNKIRFWHE